MLSKTAYNLKIESERNYGIGFVEPTNANWLHSGGLQALEGQPEVPLQDRRQYVTMPHVTPPQLLDPEHQLWGDFWNILLQDRAYHFPDGVVPWEVVCDSMMNFIAYLGNEKGLKELETGYNVRLTYYRNFAARALYGFGPLDQEMSALHHHLDKD